jgi:hypothetical protein
MYFNKRKSGLIARFFSAAFGVLMVLSFTALTVFAAVGKPVVTDESGKRLADGGQSYISGDVRLSVASQDDVTYYYSTGGLGDAIYVGLANNPSGSYLPGSLTTGALVTVPDKPTVGDITVPVPKAGQPTTVYVLAVSGDDETSLFSHAFYLSAGASGVEVRYDGKVLANKGAVYIPQNGIFDVEGPSEYVYSIGSGNYADVLYTGAEGDASGSFFDDGVFEGASFSIDASPVTPVEDDSIAVPAVALNSESKLLVSSVIGGVPRILFGQTLFNGAYKLIADFSDNEATATFLSGTNNYSGSLILAVYKGGVLANVDFAPFDVSSRDSKTVAFGVDLSQYPKEQYSYAVYAWDEGYIPIAPAIKR